MIHVADMASSSCPNHSPLPPSPCLSPHPHWAPRPTLANLPPELINLVLVRLKELARHPADRHWALAQVMSACKSLFFCTRPHAWYSVSSCLWADCASGEWACANRPARALRRQKDPIYSPLSDSHHFSLLVDSHVDPIAENVREFTFTFDAACDMAGTHFHHGRPMADSSSDSDSDDEDNSSDQSNASSSQSGSSSPGVVDQSADRHRSTLLHSRSALLVSVSAPTNFSPSFPHPVGGFNTFAPVSRKHKSCLPSDRCVHAPSIPCSVSTCLTQLKNVQKLSIINSSSMFDAATVSAVSHALQHGLSHAHLSSLTIEISSHPGEFLKHVVSLSSDTLQDLTLRLNGPSGDQPLANRAAIELIRRARNLRSLCLSCCQISIPLLTEIAKCAHLGTLELRGEIVDSHGQTFDQLWPEITSSLSSPLSRRDPGSIHTLRLFLTGGHEPLVSTIFLNLNRPLQVLEWPVHLASRVYGHLIIRTQSFLLQCPHRLASMYYDAILTDASSSPILTHMQLHGYPGREPPPHPMMYLQSLELIDVPPVDVAHLLASGAFPSLHALVVRVNDHRASAHAPWLLALLDRDACVVLGLAAAAKGLSPLTSLSVQFVLPAGGRLTRVRQVVGYRVDAAVPYVAQVKDVTVGQLAAALADATSGIVFPWMPASAGAAGVPGLTLASAEDQTGARQVRVQVKYREQPNWAHESSVAIVLDVLLCE